MPLALAQRALMSAIRSTSRNNRNNGRRKPPIYNHQIGPDMKKKVIALAAILFTSSVAFAQSNSTTSATTNAAAGGGTVVFAPQDTSTVRYATSSAFAPPLTSSNDTCMGSSSMGATGMSFGVALGSTWTD